MYLHSTVITCGGADGENQFCTLNREGNCNSDIEGSVNKDVTVSSIGTSMCGPNQAGLQKQTLHNMGDSPITETDEKLQEILVHKLWLFRERNYC